METTHYRRSPNHFAPRSSILAPRAFTLIELLVVITIIGILASLIVVAAIGALKTTQRTRTKTELNQIAGAVDEFKNKTTAYPPNCQTDKLGSTDGPIDETTVFNDLKRLMRQAFPRNQESDDLLLALIGVTPNDTTNYYRRLSGGMTAGEALVFWLGGFSNDPKYPISGEGGPSYVIQAKNDPNSKTFDPIESRGKGAGAYPFDVTRLGSRGSDGYFDDSSGRFIEYVDRGVRRRINFWQYIPAKSDCPYLYFDTSRHPVGTVSGNKLIGVYDPPAVTVTQLDPRWGLGVYAFKKAAETAGTGQPIIQFINPDKFQIIHCGLANTWDTANFARMAPGSNGDNTDLSKYLLLPTGPFIGDIAEAIVNFTTEPKIEDAQK